MSYFTHREQKRRDSSYFLQSPYVDFPLMEQFLIGERSMSRVEAIIFKGKTGKPEIFLFSGNHLFVRWATHFLMVNDTYS